ncbi:hypothetical protein N9A64_05475, partial [Pseudomonadales bacterium]|nr:hypothetical protein [Pseudomonadales bacterium]
AEYIDIQYEYNRLLVFVLLEHFIFRSPKMSKYLDYTSRNPCSLANKGIVYEITQKNLFQGTKTGFSRRIWLIASLG